ncbi:MAG: HEAT repeat domain-containing protein [Promethearchaeota archaeon]
MNEEEKQITEIKTIKDFVRDGRFDDAVNIIALYISDSTEEDYIDRLENVIETLLALHGGRTVLRFLLENLIIDIPSLLENLSKKDSVLRYTFLLLIKTICENESDLFLPYSEDLLKSDDPNVREADLQLIIYMADAVANMEDQSLIRAIVEKLNDEKDFVVEKTIQALIAIGRISPSIITKILTDFAKETLEVSENEKVKHSIDTIMKSIVTVEKIEEIVEEEKSKLEKPSEVTVSDGTLSLEKEESEILDKEFELKKKELEIKKKKLELEEKEKEIEEKVIQKKEEVLKLKEEILIKEGEISEEPDTKEKLGKIKIPKKLKKEESEIIDKEIELKKKDLEIKKKKLEIEEKEKELEEKEIKEREKALKLKEELIEKEKELSQVELELKQKSIEQKEQNIKEEEMKRVADEIKKIQREVEEDDDN